MATTLRISLRVKLALADAENVLAKAQSALCLEKFRLCYAKIAEPAEFLEPETIPDGPLIVHIVLTNDIIKVFDGFLLRTPSDLRDGPETLWLESEWP